ncbi:hypothetical protein M9Y10_027845 [Tritrichomonas musculus]|uniref:Uncharacterized protein n=1 Tax=Tritrichomonas musculus TaxID=1915356 RepID=A0ABR2H577_9EUKA
MSAPVSQVPSRCPSPTSYSQPVSTSSSNSSQGFGDWINWPPSAQGSPVGSPLEPSWFSISTEDYMTSSQEAYSENEYESVFQRKEEILEKIQTIEYKILLEQRKLAALNHEKLQLDSLFK